MDVGTKRWLEWELDSVRANIRHHRLRVDEAACEAARERHDRELEKLETSLSRLARILQNLNRVLDGNASVGSSDIRVQRARGNHEQDQVSCAGATACHS